MQVLESTPDEVVRWKCVGGPSEWIGTELTFRLLAKDDQTFVLFTHAGWRDPVEFMHHCSTKWAVFLLSLKGWAASQTQSMAMLGSLADTALDLVASLVTLWGVRVAAQPADSDHRFGHGKAEALVALVQIVLISLSAVGIAVRSTQRLIAGAQTQEAELGIVVSLVAMGATLALILYQRSIIRRTGSVAIATAIAIFVRPGYHRR